jgi:multidrug efflux pump subunit AcrB
MAFTDTKMREVEDIIMKDPNVDRYFSAVGGFSGGESNAAFVFVTLKERSQRKLSQEKVAAVFREKLGAVKDIRVFVPNGMGGAFGGGSFVLV